MGLENMADERSREIFLSACAEIARSFGPLGFRYLRSKSRIERSEGDLRFEILLVTGRRNYKISPNRKAAAIQALQQVGHYQNFEVTDEMTQAMLGGSVHLDLRARVDSAELKRWRSSQVAPLRTDDFVAGDELGRLRTPPKVQNFNLAPTATRRQSIVEAGALAHEVGLPFFDQFRKPASLLTRLLQADPPGFWEATTFEYVLCFGGRQPGVELLRHRLAGDSELRCRFVELLPVFKGPSYQALAARQRVQGMQLGGHRERAGRLATIAATYGLDADL
jgi:hypothetical protein